MKVPAPTFCPDCRFQRRIAFRNGHKLFKVKDAFSGEDIFSLYPPHALQKVITQEEWFSDSWNAMDYGRDYNFSKSLFAQLFELNKEVPVINLNVSSMIDSPYCANASNLKNCYLIFCSDGSQDCQYGVDVDESKDSVDNLNVVKLERCYDCFWSKNCYQCHGCVICDNCRNMYFCRDCIGCNDCIGCTNLLKSSYCIFNKQYSKEEYKKFVDTLALDTYDGFNNLRKQSRDFWKTQINKYDQGLRNANSDGSYVANSKNVTQSYMIRDSEDLTYCQLMMIAANKDCLDVSIWGLNTSSCYEVAVSGSGIHDLKFCLDCWPECRSCEYSLHLKSCSDCFGCVGLRNKQYCVFNKQYTKEEYYIMVERIKKQMDEMPYIDTQGLVYKYGEFFPIELSPFGYNNSIVNEHFPLTKESAETYGYKWIDVERGNYDITKKAQDLLDNISDVTDDIIKEIIECENCKNPYKIIADELAFYRKENVPIPYLCADCRHDRRLKDRLNFQLYERECMCVGAKDKTNQYANTATHFHGTVPCIEKFKTGYNPSVGDIVYCEKCYQSEVN